MLNVSQKTYLEVNYSNLADHIKQSYNLSKRFEIYPISNDTYQVYDVYKTSTALSFHEKYDAHEVQEHLKRGNCEHYQLGAILLQMCIDGHIDEGCYLVEFSW